MKSIPIYHLCYSSYDDELVIIIGRKMDPSFRIVRYLYRSSDTTTLHISYLTDLGSLHNLSIPFRNYSSTAECLHYHPELLV